MQVKVPRTVGSVCRLWDDPKFPRTVRMQRDAYDDGRPYSLPHLRIELGIAAWANAQVMPWYCAALCCMNTSSSRCPRHHGL